MGYKSRILDPPLYYEEKTVTDRKRRFCLKKIKLIETKAAKDEDCVNVQFNRGNKTNINIDKVEEKKIHEHFDFVTAKLQKLHKSVMWNMFIGRSFLENIEPVKVSKEEVSLDNSASTEFNINNAKTWSKDCITHIENTLRVNEIPTDGIVCLFSVPNDDTEHDIDSDEVAWEIEKVAVYHCVNNYEQRLLNQEGCMARQGLEPISRKVRTPGRNRSGYVVYLSYQLVDNVTFSQVMVETVLYSVDMEKKKKQILHQLGDLKMSPPVDDRNRKVIKDVKEFMGKEQVEILHQLKDMKDANKLSVIAQFIQLLHAGGEGQGGMAGLNQFVTFLSQKDSITRSSSRQSVMGSRLSSNSVRIRKQSTSSSLSSTSTLPDSPRTNSASSRKSSSPNIASRRKTSSASRRQSNLADIQSDQESPDCSEKVLPAGVNAETGQDARNGRGKTNKPTSLQESQDKQARTKRTVSGGKLMMKGGEGKVEKLVGEKK